MLALIDSDVLVYRCGFAAQHRFYDVYIIGEEELGAWQSFPYKKEAKAWVDGEDTVYEIRPRVVVEPLAFCLQAVKHTINAILRAVNTNDFILLLSGPDNFRNELVDYYKENRKDAVKPIYYKQIREYMIDVWGAKVTKGIEADDALSKIQWNDYKKGSTGTVICTIDKDLLMVPGKHYNFMTKKHLLITELEGMRNFYRQILTGDNVDDIPGYYKFTGNKCSKKIKEGLEECTTVEDMEEYVVSTYIVASNKSRAKVEAYIEEIGNLLWMRRESIKRDEEGNITNLWRLGETHVLEL